MISEYEDIRRGAMTWIREAGNYSRERFGSAVVSQKKDRSLVTDVDHAVQQMLLDAIARHHPNDAVIAEEIQSEPGKHASIASANRCWIVDPIDGTRNYARGVPTFSISVAMMDGGRPAVGLVFAPMMNWMYSASAGGGAYLNDEAIHSSGKESISGGTLISVPSGRQRPMPAVVHGWLDELVLRNLGSTALHLCLLACGSFDVVFCDECRLWDIAAGVLIVEEAGAKVISLMDGKPHFPTDLTEYDNGIMPFLAGNPKVIQQLFSEYQQLDLKL